VEIPGDVWYGQGGMTNWDAAAPAGGGGGGGTEYGGGGVLQGTMKSGYCSRNMSISFSGIPATC